jgi:RNA polymerase sigma-70 factor (ECF subfamily)
MRQSPPAFARLAERHRAEIQRYLGRLLGNDADAQDACQETFLRAQRAFARLVPGSNARAWLYRIATNAARNAARGRSRRTARIADVALDGLPADATATPEDRMQLRAVARAAEALPPRQRAALVLRQFQDLDYAEIAATLGGTEAAARANVYQALKKLRSALGGE